MPKDTSNIKRWRFRFDRSKPLHDKAVINFKRCEQWDKGQLPDGFKPFFTGQYAYKSSLVPKTLVEDLRRFKNKGIGMLFSTEDWMQFAGLEGQEDIAELNRNLIKFQFNHRLFSFKKFMQDVFDHWKIYGPARAITKWIRDEKTGYEGYSKELVSPYRFFPATYTDSKGQLPYFIIRSVIMYKDLKEMAKAKKWTTDDIDDISKNLTQFPKEEADEYSLEIKNLDIQPEDPEEKDYYPVLIEECFCDQKKTTMVNKFWDLGTVDVVAPNNGLTELKMWATGNEVYSPSLIQWAEDEFFEMFLQRNAAIDMIELQKGGLILSSDPATPASGFIEAIPGKITKVGDTARYLPLDLKVNSRIPFEHAQVLREELKDFFNLADVFAGREPQRQDTATRDTIVTRNAGNDMAEIMGDIEEQFIKEILYEALEVNRQMLPDDLPEPYLQQIGIERREQIETNWTISIVGVETSTAKSVATGLFMQFTQLAPGTPMSAEIVWNEAARTVVDALGLPNKDKLVRDPAKDMADIQRENKMLMAGIKYPVNPEDNHELHWQGQYPIFQMLQSMEQQGSMSFELAQLMQQTELQIDDIVEVFKEHLDGHRQFMKPLSGTAGISMNGSKPVNEENVNKQTEPYSRVPQPQEEI